MKIKVNEGHAGVITLRDGSVFNYGIKRYVLKTDTLVFYTGKALNELFKSNPSDEQKKNSIKILDYTEKELEKLGYLGKIKMSEVASYT
ncbi:hypothetical protein V3471_13165 [Flavobacterium oreochromis]|jgi:hypothetical protein|uniref:hypothetical protein n=1 Tax=Flavobacterium oreochromis TaxID=2906078 RepID=UPI00385CFFA2